MVHVKFGSVVLVAMMSALVQADVEVPPPTVHEDGSVTFRRFAPNAKNVTLSLEGKTKPIPMIKDEAGVWSVTTKAMPPDIYAYYFFIDNVREGDPSNEEQLSMITGGAQGLLHISGPETLVWERGDEPQGTIETVGYQSQLIGEPRRLTVYLPPSYQSRGGARYPVLYLLHGVLCDEQSWTTAGRANVILDNLLESGEIRPMIVVMPQGYGFTNPAQNVYKLFGPMNHKEWMECFAKSLLTEVIPAIETRYAVRAEREARAIAGFSMGGAQALYIGLNHPQSFGRVGCMSSAFTLYGGQPDSFLSHATKTPANERPELWLTTGTEDLMYGPNKQIMAWLESQDIAARFEETPGGHTWGVWRRALASFAPGLFRHQ